MASTSRRSVLPRKTIHTNNNIDTLNTHTHTPVITITSSSSPTNICIDDKDLCDVSKQHHHVLASPSSTISSSSLSSMPSPSQSSGKLPHQHQRSTAPQQRLSFFPSPAAISRTPTSTRLSFQPTTSTFISSSSSSHTRTASSSSSTNRIDSLTHTQSTSHTHTHNLEPLPSTMPMFCKVEVLPLSQQNDSQAEDTDGVCARSRSISNLTRSLLERSRSMKKNQLVLLPDLRIVCLPLSMHAMMSVEDAIQALISKFDLDGDKYNYNLRCVEECDDLERNADMATRVGASSATACSRNCIRSRGRNGQRYAVDRVATRDRAESLDATDDRDGSLDEGKGRIGSLDATDDRDGSLDEGKDRDGSLDEGKGRVGSLDATDDRDGSLDEGKDRDGFLDEGKGRIGSLDEGKDRDGSLDEGKGRIGSLDESNDTLSSYRSPTSSSGNSGDDSTLISCSCYRPDWELPVLDAQTDVRRFNVELLALCYRRRRRRSLHLSLSSADTGISSCNSASRHERVNSGEGLQSHLLQIRMPHHELHVLSVTDDTTLRDILVKLGDKKKVTYDSEVYTFHAIGKSRILDLNTRIDELYTLDIELRALSTEPVVLPIYGIDEIEPTHFVFTEASASPYKKWSVLKKNRFGRKQRRYLGIDRTTIYNYSDTQRVKRFKRCISDVVDARIVASNRLAFEIMIRDLYYNEMQILHYETSSEFESAEIVARLNFLRYLPVDIV